MKVNISSETNLGKVRQRNEDLPIGIKGILGSENIVLAGAIDGVGGYSGGEEASRIAKQFIEGIVLESSEDAAPALLVKVAFVEANNRIFEGRALTPVYHKMSCVLTFAILDANKEAMYYAHCGDSRAYVFRNGELIKITKDQSLVGHMEDSGDILEEDALNHPRRNEIFKMLGEKRLDPSSDYFDSGEYSFYPGDIVLFCSDGLTDLVNREGIKSILEQECPLPEKVHLLIDKANELGGKDNITVSLVEFEGEKRAKPKEKNIEVAVSKKTHTKKSRNLLFTILLIALPLILGYFILQWYLKFDDVFSHNNGRAKVEKNSKYGFIDKMGNLIVPIIYDEAFDFTDTLAAVKLGNKWGYIDLNGKEVIPASFDCAWPFTQGLAAVQVGGKWGFINSKGKYIIPLKYNQVKSFHEGFAAIKVDSTWGFVDSNDLEHISPIYSNVTDFNNGVARVFLGEDTCYIDKSGQFVTDSLFEIKPNSHELQAIKRHGKWGFINSQNDVVIPTQFDDVKAFSEGLAPVKRFGRWFYINTKGEYIIYK